MGENFRRKFVVLGLIFFPVIASLEVGGHFLSKLERNIPFVVTFDF